LEDVFTSPRQALEELADTGYQCKHAVPLGLRVVLGRVARSDPVNLAPV
jgi:hypothetical protein